MSTLISEFLTTGVTPTQEIKISKPITVTHVRFWVTILGPLTEPVVAYIRDGATLLQTATITAAEINAIPGEQYKHGWLRFDFNCFLGFEHDKLYTIEIDHQDNNQVLMLNRTWDGPVYPIFNPEISALAQPYGIEVYALEGVV